MPCSVRLSLIPHSQPRVLTSPSLSRYHHQLRASFHVLGDLLPRPSLKSRFHFECSKVNGCLSLLVNSELFLSPVCEKCRIDRVCFLFHGSPVAARVIYVAMLCGENICFSSIGRVCALKILPCIIGSVTGKSHGLGHLLKKCGGRTGIVTHTSKSASWKCPQSQALRRLDLS